MHTFGIVAEGITDQVVIKNILYGLLGSEKLEDANFLQPMRDQTDSFGNWYNVIEYCGSERVRKDFENNDFIVIQIDTDTSEEKHFDIPKHDENNKELSVEQLIMNVFEKLKTLIINKNGIDFWEYYEQKIIFAIAVHSTECWLLPLYATSKREMEATKNCHNRLGKLLKTSIKKEAAVYEGLSKPFMKSKELLKVKDKNPSLRIFIENLETQVII